MESNEMTARTILDQLGARRFLMMTGASSLTFGDRDLTMKLPIGKAGGCRIELRVDDTYTVKFFKREQFKTVVRNGGQTVLASFDDVYAENLRELFERQTGLALTLGKVVFA